MYIMVKQDNPFYFCLYMSESHTCGQTYVVVIHMLRSYFYCGHTSLRCGRTSIVVIHLLWSYFCCGHTSIVVILLLRGQWSYMIGLYTGARYSHEISRPESNRGRTSGYDKRGH